MTGSLFRKLLLAAMAATIAAVVASNLTFSYTARSVVIEGLGKTAANLAVQAANDLDPTVYEALLTGTADPASLRVPMVEELRYVQDGLVSHGVDNLYVVAPKGSVFYLLADITDDNPPLKVTDDANVALKRDVLTSNKATFTTEPYTDSWGSWISGFAPIPGANGTPIAVLGLDLPMGAFPLIDEITKQNLLVAMVPAFVLALGLSVYLTRRLTRPVRDIITGLARVETGDLSAHVEIKSRDELEQMGRSFNAMTQGLRERERIRSVFHQAVSREIAEEMLNSGLRTDGETRTLAVLFSDLRGFTSLSEHMAPQDVISMLNEYFTAMAPIVTKHGGVIDKFVGDEIMAIFGAPLPLDNPSVAAIACALEMMDALERLNGTRVKRNEPPLRIGIGINTGPAVAGNLGSPERLNYTVLGRAINVGARFCSQAAAGDIIVGQTAHDDARSRFAFQALEPLTLKGLSRPLEAYRVVAKEE